MKNPTRIKTFGTHLRKLRERSGFSQQQLADQAELSKITIQRIENAKFCPTLDTLISLAEALDIGVPELVDF